LALPATIGLESCKDRQHAKKAHRSRRGVDVLLDDLQMCACLLDPVADVGIMLAIALCLVDSVVALVM
jgi:hypothetical protein